MTKAPRLQGAIKRPAEQININTHQGTQGTSHHYDIPALQNTEDKAKILKGLREGESEREYYIQRSEVRLTSDFSTHGRQKAVENVKNILKENNDQLCQSIPKTTFKIPQFTRTHSPQDIVALTAMVCNSKSTQNKINKGKKVTMG